LEEEHPCNQANTKDKMRLSLLIQPCLFGIAIVKANGDGVSHKLDWDNFEFGRDALIEEFSDAEV
jgi:hypothetical protein